MTEADWQRVVDEKFYVKEVGGIACNNLLIPESINSLIACGYEIVREKGLRQPHFQGHPHPEGDVVVVAYYPKGHGKRVGMAENIEDWDAVREYIIL